MTETIYALATPLARSGVAVIRISGNNAIDSLSHFGIMQTPPPRKAMYASFLLSSSNSSCALLTASRNEPDALRATKDGGLLAATQPLNHSTIQPSTLNHQPEILDTGLVIYFPAPHSFTGEDCIEFQIHGSLAVIKKFLSELSSLPHFRLAEAGEFARRAFQNQKFDLTAAEGLADLIDAETEMQRRLASPSVLGHVAKYYQELRASVLQSLAFLEAYIDFPDEDIPDSVYAQVASEITKIEEQITSLLASSEGAEKIREGFSVVIIGAPNAGKSTLLNALAKRDVAIVSPLAGTTRDMIEIHLDLHGLPVTLIDTAGLRETSDAIESEGVARALKRSEEADLTIALFDQTAPLDPATLLVVTEYTTEKTLVVFTKSDLPKHPSAASDSMRCLESISVCAHTPATLSPLLEKVEHHLRSRVKLADSAMVSRQRHRDHLMRAAAELSAYPAERSLELQCERLRLAAAEIGKITGIIQVDELLGVIFSSFCIGK